MKRLLTATASLALFLSCNPVQIDRRQFIPQNQQPSVIEQLELSKQFEGFKPRIGADNWYTNWNTNTDDDSATDFETALIRSKIISPEASRETQNRTQTAIQFYFLSDLSEMFLNKPNGELNDNGIRASFIRPDQKDIDPNNTNILCFTLDSIGALGRSTYDIGNNDVDCLCGNQPLLGYLGVEFPQAAIPDILSQTYGLKNLDIKDEDLPYLRELFSEGPKSARALEIEKGLRQYAEELAYRSAHEIGHASGLNHDDSNTWNTMNSDGTILGVTKHEFSPESANILRENINAKYE